MIFFASDWKFVKCNKSIGFRARACNDTQNIATKELSTVCRERKGSLLPYNSMRKITKKGLKYIDSVFNCRLKSTRAPTRTHMRVKFCWNLYVHCIMYVHANALRRVKRNWFWNWFAGDRLFGFSHFAHAKRNYTTQQSQQTLCVYAIVYIYRNQQ